ncbi:MAG: TIGR03643 family protein [Crocinitomicaceae bacterium]|nr:TIGR03643 family protein [Crocinitomicaceae bacterium]|tara:strand:- start:79637 stop:79921 length:285 start_codon:yes stop_codon:yes gene_type:complete
MAPIKKNHDLDRIIEMAWEDRTPFDAIKLQFGLEENDVRILMRKHLKPNSFILWRKRVKGRKTKHLKVRGFKSSSFRCSRQKVISNNKITKSKK